MYTQEKPDLAIYHAGVMGMKWGHRKARKISGKARDPELDYLIYLEKHPKSFPDDHGLTTMTTKAQTAALKKTSADSLTFGKALVYSALGTIGILSVRAITGL